jgi:hypothetical protein
MYKKPKLQLIRLSVRENWLKNSLSRFIKIDGFCAEEQLNWHNKAVLLYQIAHRGD